MIFSFGGGGVLAFIPFSFPVVNYIWTFPAISTIPVPPDVDLAPSAAWRASPSIPPAWEGPLPSRQAGLPCPEHRKKELGGRG